MKQIKFKSSTGKIEVSGGVIEAFVNAIPGRQASRLELLQKYGIINPQKSSWYPLQNLLSTFEEIFGKGGSDTSFQLIGKAIVSNAKFPRTVGTEEAFSSLNEAYKMNHQGGDIGQYTLSFFGLEKKEIKMDVNTPYPLEFDKGVLLGVFLKFKPKNCFSLPEVTIQPLSNSFLYTIKWK